MALQIQDLNDHFRDSLINHLGIEIIEFGKGQVVAKMPVNSATKQPMGYLHGGASLALAETVAGVGSFLITDVEKNNVFGMNVTANHLASVQNGFVLASAKILHKGKTTHVWDVEIKDETGRLISIARVTNMVVPK